jgi:hypothetical protein
MLTSILGARLRWHLADGWVFDPVIVGPDNIEYTLKEGPHLGRHTIQRTYYQRVAPGIEQLRANRHIEVAMSATCEFCGRQHRLMEVCPQAPGLLDILRGARGEAWRLYATVAVCVLVVLFAIGAEVIAR